MSDDVRMGLVISGAALALIAILWWLTSRRRRKRRLVRQLRATDPQERARAGIRLVDLGFSTATRPLLDHVSGETDARVRLAIALAVARRQWEPNNATRVARLRDWASVELEQQGQAVEPFGPAMTRISDMGGPRPDDQGPAKGPVTGPAKEAAVPEPSIDWHPGGGA
jgi:hypothetical protein